MSDRRQREPARCLIAGCVHVGYWPRGYCPVHYNQVVEQLAAAIHRVRHPEPDASPASPAAWLSDLPPTLSRPSHTPAPPGTGHHNSE